MLPDQWSVVVDECARGCSQQVEWSLASADRRTTASSPQQTAATQPTQLTLGWVYCKSSIFLYFVCFISLFKKVTGLLLLCPASWLCGQLRRKLKGKVYGEGIWWREVGREAAGGMCLLSKCLDKFVWRLWCLLRCAPPLPPGHLSSIIPHPKAHNNIINIWTSYNNIVLILCGQYYTTGGIAIFPVSVATICPATVS